MERKWQTAVLNLKELHIKYFTRFKKKWIETQRKNTMVLKNNPTGLLEMKVIEENDS